MVSPFQGAPFALTTASNPVRASIRAGHRREETGATATIRDPGTSQAWGNALKRRGARRMEGESRDFPPWGLLHDRGMTDDRCGTHLLPLEGESALSGVASPPTPERQASDDPPGVEVPRSSDEFQPNFRRLAEHPEGSLAIRGDRRDARYRDPAGTSAARRPIRRGRELALRTPEATPSIRPEGSTSRGSSGERLLRSPRSAQVTRTSDPALRGSPMRAARRGGISAASRSSSIRDPRFRIRARRSRRGCSCSPPPRCSRDASSPSTAGAPGPGRTRASPRRRSGDRRSRSCAPDP